MTRDDLIETLTRRLMDEGRIIEAGWKGFEAIVLPPVAPPAQRHAMRLAFMAGAQHLWGSVMTGLDPAVEPTAEDMRRMDLIDAEMKVAATELARVLGVRQ